MEVIDSKIVVLNNERYLVYLKRVAVKSSKYGPRFAVRPFVKWIGRRQETKIEGIVRRINRSIDRIVGL